MTNETKTWAWAWAPVALGILVAACSGAETSGGATSTGTGGEDPSPAPSTQQTTGDDAATLEDAGPGSPAQTSDASAPVADAAPGPASDYDTAIAYTKTRPAFTPSRTVTVTSQAELQTAIAGLLPGDLIDCVGAFTVSGEFTIAKQLTAPAVIDFKTGASAVKFVGVPGQNVPALWIPNASNLRLYGGDFTTQNTGGSGILVHGGHDMLLWGFTIHDCGGSGLSMLNVHSITTYDVQGEISRSGLNLAWDPHAEKGTGLHGAILADTSQTYPFANNRIALYVHDQPSGAAVEIGEDQAISQYGGNVLYLKAVDLTMVATSQVGGNALQLWGASGMGLDVKYIEATNCQGRAVWGGGFYSASAGAGVTIEKGTASHVGLSPTLGHTEPGLPATEPWDTRWGIQYTVADVTPHP